MSEQVRNYCGPNSSMFQGHRDPYANGDNFSAGRDHNNGDLPRHSDSTPSVSANYYSNNAKHSQNTYYGSTHIDTTTNSTPRIQGNPSLWSGSTNSNGQSNFPLQPGQWLGLGGGTSLSFDPATNQPLLLVNDPHPQAGGFVGLNGFPIHSNTEGGTLVTPQQSSPELQTWLHDTLRASRVAIHSTPAPVFTPPPEEGAPPPPLPARQYTVLLKNGKFLGFYSSDSEPQKPTPGAPRSTRVKRPPELRKAKAAPKPSPELKEGVYRPRSKRLHQGLGAVDLSDPNEQSAKRRNLGPRQETSLRPSSEIAQPSASDSRPKCELKSNNPYHPLRRLEREPMPTGEWNKWAGVVASLPPEASEEPQASSSSTRPPAIETSQRTIGSTTYNYATINHRRDKPQRVKVNLNDLLRPSRPPARSADSTEGSVASTSDQEMEEVEEIVLNNTKLPGSDATTPLSSTTGRSDRSNSIGTPPDDKKKPRWHRLWWRG
ncbi:hypothetical protein CC1G_02143 [Coprinopsis cinerea okayama7|uniref:Uncharacterized protein n=1 Tax=Coprinopsis cinerea (strain Okayama-7 / 130 / ATCC MYA-4618 / FGSC 9003) TaxID=240176 RepID=A8NKC2_COPC7|nr:hypothetical protein CC1G_02143 [Coprinopsis cinerea okayama7\|eukprot:XP_001834407.2 hypothetical protein CC1G_02143 [Coprinopsis cinerea okayama7\